jgi:ribonuclease HI
MEMMNLKWQHMATSTDGDNCELEGIKIWQHKWNPTGERIIAKDPMYNQNKHFQVYEIISENKILRFAAGEFSNCVWGFYLQNILERE